jgi:photosystem II stability/assembly factor-like uncharacterized protein
VMKYRFILLLTLLILPASIIGSRADDSTHDTLSNTASNGEVRRWEVTGPWGGDVRALVASPDNENHFYLGTTDGQIFRSTDGAQSWQRLKPGLNKRGLSVDNLVIDPRNGKVIYAAAWSVSQGATENGGVFKSEDGGDNWTLLSATKGLTLLSLSLAPSDPGIVMAGAKSGLFRSNDGGKNWERISPEGHPEIRNINSIGIDPKDPNIIYVGTHHLPWKTTDGGANWKAIGYGTGLLDDSDIMGICVSPTRRELLYINACSGIYRSVASGEKWTKLPGIPFSARRTYALLDHPTQPNVIFAGTSEGLYRSNDGGKNWKLRTSKSVVIRAIVVHPSKPNRVLIATDDFGVRVSDNLGDDFTDANTGFIHRHILEIMPDANERGRILASVYHDGSGGSIFASSDGGENWQPSSAGLGPRDVFALYQMPDNASVIYAGTNNGVYRSDDRGSNWSFVGIVEKPAPAKKPAPSRTTRGKKRSAVVPAVGRYQAVPAQRSSSSKKKAPPRAAPQKKPVKVVDPAEARFVTLTNQVDDITGFSNTEGQRGLLAATMDGLYRTFDETKGWEKVAITGYEKDSRVYSVATHRDLPTKILVGTRKGLFASFDGGGTWEHVDRGPSDMTVKSIAISLRDPFVVLLGTNQFVFRSTNGGRTWTKRGGGLPAGDFTSAVVNPDNPDEMLVSEYSSGGVYLSTDKGYTWERIDRGELPSNRVWTIVFDPFDKGRAYAGSFSSGVYVLTIQKGVATKGR